MAITAATAIITPRALNAERILFRRKAIIAVTNVRGISEGKVRRRGVAGASVAGPAGPGASRGATPAALGATARAGTAAPATTPPAAGRRAVGEAKTIDHLQRLDNLRAINYLRAVDYVRAMGRLASVAGSEDAGSEDAGQVPAAQPQVEGAGAAVAVAGMAGRRGRG